MTFAVDLNKRWGWFLVYGLALVVLGVVAISASIVTTLLSMMFLGIVLVIGGVVVIIDSFKYIRREYSHFILYLILGLLYLLAGIIFIKNPFFAAVTFTLMLGLIYLVIGFFRIIEAVASQLPHWGWSLLSGLVALLLGILILEHWPGSSLIIIGLFVGIDLIFAGWAYIMLSLSARAAR